MLEEFIQLDKEVFLFLNGLGTETWDGFWMYLSEKISLITIPLYVFLLFLSYKSFGLKKTGILLVSIALMITCTDQLANFFKYGVGRFRPCHDEEIRSLMRLVKSYCGGKYGYFSAHAASSFALASFFTILFKTSFKFLIPFLLIWALLVSYSRIYIGVHFPLDVLTGLAMGFLLGWIFAKLYIFATFKFKA
ncbi:phosphatase PAP2 family protein [Croceitalea rosinachiae]|uniref:Phosphatase PAP2 family protein n=1 Tax=Croceitalea rosinachiae TaxID=3075596 RepID=A0ABU3AAI9_9FLAO|nr:phosphatase PAP2 family protein [Croceitalea sp. F388]MDT0606930.1 phosphatase PAP2 family protein [Croceitalea sp. F388]